MSSVNYELVGDLAVLTLSHEGAPVIGNDLMDQLGTQVRRARADGSRALLLRADGRVFAAGADVAGFKGMSEAEARTMFTDYMSVVHEIERLGVPTVAAVHGMCLGGGLELALACDLIVAQKGTMFGQVEARLGGATFLGGTQRLAERCGTARALEISYSASLYTADAFASWGIVSRVVDEDNFEAKAMSLAASLAGGPTAAHRVTKQVLRTARAEGVRDADALVLQLGPALLETADMQAAVDTMMTMGSRDFMADPSPVDFRGE
ncbi:enoyl-CoA hydratase/isomerase family protein [Nonomuraea basaltis]|uniref:enoyl-CoA hydratase/isomerase family protein n=1 Tax=Nonomuraea basaltis TaxID=2495887 RepID=UPI00110C42F3|nr:enoyl-CoA hydratase/isomerase family protein [Nonomuraea basaltis]TMR93321.1 enoyl-CoA hydratase/isomerase family protein [Nonomuraea basaltis]